MSLHELLQEKREDILRVAAKRGHLISASLALLHEEKMTHEVT